MSKRRKEPTTTQRMKTSVTALIKLKRKINKVYGILNSKKKERRMLSFDYPKKKDKAIQKKNMKNCRKDRNSFMGAMICDDSIWKLVSILTEVEKADKEAVKKLKQNKVSKKKVKCRKSNLNIEKQQVCQGLSVDVSSEEVKRTNDEGEDRSEECGMALDTINNNVQNNSNNLFPCEVEPTNHQDVDLNNTHQGSMEEDESGNNTNENRDGNPEFSFTREGFYFGGNQNNETAGLVQESRFKGLFNDRSFLTELGLSENINSFDADNMNDYINDLSDIYSSVGPSAEETNHSGNLEEKSNWKIIKNIISRITGRKKSSNDQPIPSYYHGNTVWIPEQVESIPENQPINDRDDDSSMEE